MKKNQLFQFSLTVICSMVLAACGSSGGSSNPTTQATNTTPATNAPVQQPTETPAQNTTSEIANGNNTAANQDAKPVTVQPDATPYIGAKHVSKRDSKFVIEGDGNNYASGAGLAIGMNVKKPNPSFDTIVVAEPTQPAADGTFKVGYLEDFDFRLRPENDKDAASEKVANTDANTVSPDHGKLPNADAIKAAAAKIATADEGIFVMPNIHFGKPKTTFAGKEFVKGTDDTAGTHFERNALGGKDGNSKTNFVGETIDATALVYHTDRTNYTGAKFAPNRVAVMKAGSNTEFRNALSAVSGDVKHTDSRTKEILDKNTASTIESSASDGVEKNVAEVYGYRTFAEPGQFNDVPKDVAGQNNLPLENKQLVHVQYGRVTADLSNQTSFDEFREGIGGSDKLKTYVVDYGAFGAKGTEDHYFYRGINAIDDKGLAELKKANNNKGVLQYYGHAVSYGLNDEYTGEGLSTNAPTAIQAGTAMKFVSGNHAVAHVDLASNHVEGAIYNTWLDVSKAANNNNDTTFNGEGTKKPVDLVRFTGTLGSSGNIAGTSVRQDNKAEGVFAANLYGANARELGGVVASNDKTPTGKWGAVFGAIRYDAPAANGIKNNTNTGDRLGLGLGN